MPYNPTEWASGDVVTSEKLNKIERGIAAAGGGGLPSYTSEDIGKTLTVNAETQATVIVPEQEVTTDETGNGDLTGVDFSSLLDGDAVTLTVDGEAITEVDFVYHDASEMPVEGIYFTPPSGSSKPPQLVITST